MKKVLVVGDIMVDEYVYGSIDRISPEAPIPVLKAENREIKLGGAGNVAKNIISLGAQAAGQFYIGGDLQEAKLRSLLTDSEIDIRWSVENEAIPEIKKTRFVANQQQVVRVDYNDSIVVSADITEHFIKNSYEAIQWSDIIVISDYGKGTCSEVLCQHVIKMANRTGKIVIVDPKGNDWGKYKGATIITPNLKEINAFSGKNINNSENDIISAYKNLPEQLGIKYVLITRSEQGMTLIGNNEFFSIGVRQQKVFDVSGAGDTVVASLAVFLDSNCKNIKQVMNIANTAAGIVVGKPGTAIVTKLELMDALSVSELSIDNIIYTIEKKDSFVELINTWRKAGETIITTNGCFDIIHRGHISLLRSAKQEGNHLVVLLNSDESVRRIKGKDRPINNERDRAYVLAAIECVDAVVIFDPKSANAFVEDDAWDDLDIDRKKIAKESPIGWIKLISPDLHIKGGDYIEEQVPEAIFAKSFKCIPYVKGYSTTNIVESLKG